MRGYYTADSYSPRLVEEDLVCQSVGTQYSVFPSWPAQSRSFFAAESSGHPSQSSVASSACLENEQWRLLTYCKRWRMSCWLPGNWPPSLSTLVFWDKLVSWYQAVGSNPFEAHLSCSVLCTFSLLKGFGSFYHQWIFGIDVCLHMCFWPFFLVQVSLRGLFLERLAV